MRARPRGRPRGGGARARARRATAARPRPARARARSRDRTDRSRGPRPGARRLVTIASRSARLYGGVRFAHGATVPRTTPWDTIPRARVHETLGVHPLSDAAMQE